MLRLGNGSGARGRCRGVGQQGEVLFICVLKSTQPLTQTLENLTHCYSVQPTKAFSKVLTIGVCYYFPAQHQRLSRNRKLPGARSARGGTVGNSLLGWALGSIF